MKNNIKKSILGITMSSICLMTALTGCSGSFIGDDVASYPLASKMTLAEAIDYYSESLKYDAIISRNLNVHETTYELVEIQGQKADKLKALVTDCEAILGNEEYDNTDENKQLVSPDTYGYIRGLLDNDVLSEGSVKQIQGALGYYFVDVEYKVSPKAPGSFTNAANLVGIDGMFYLNYKNEYNIDIDFLRSIAISMNEYFFQNNIKRNCEFIEDSLSLEIQDGVDPVVSNFWLTYEDETTSNLTQSSEYDGGSISDNEALSEEDGSDKDIDEDADTEDTDSSDTDTETDTDDTSENTDAEANDTEDTDAEATDTDTETTTDDTDTESTTIIIDDSEDEDATLSYTIVTPKDRRVDPDIILINSVVGSSLRQRAIVPQLDYVYNIPGNEGTICGYGIYPSGDNGLRTFGFDRSRYSGTMTLRYVFKDDSKGTGDILGYNIYCIEENITNGITITDSNVLVPEFLLGEFEQLIERSDRAMVNNDIVALVAGSDSAGLIYEDMGVGILRGNREKSTNINRYMSTIRQVVSRDTSNNSYLLDVETTVIEGPKDVDCYGTYKDRYYVVIQQQNDRFVITDSVRIARTVQNEPPINPDTNIQKKLIALNLAGPVDDTAKDSIRTLLGQLYTAGTNRITTGPETIKIGGNDVTIDKGIVDVFTSDVTVMSTDDKDYLISTMQNQLTKYGADVPSIYSGTVTEWIGGYENQVEFTTEEFIYYPAKNKGFYMQVYYLVSVNHDEWVIDERAVLDDHDVEEEGEIASICERLGINR